MAASGTKKSVLIVDDQIAETLRIGLEASGASRELVFRTAADGAACLEVARIAAPDLILLDYEMPVIDGLRVLYELQRRNVRTRIIMMSGSRTDLRSAIECVKAGACDYIVKSGTSDELLSRIRAALAVESTLNARVSELPSSARQLISEASLLLKEHEELREKWNALHGSVGTGRGRLIWETMQKAVYVGLAAGCAYMLMMWGAAPALAGPLAFVLLFALLLVPADRIQTMSANLTRVIRARVSLDSGRRSQRLVGDASRSVGAPEEPKHG